MKTALVGQFKDGLMSHGREAKVIAERCNDGFKEIKVSRVKNNTTVFKYSRPTSSYIGDQPNKMDPYEKQYIYVGKSERGDDAIFAKQDLKIDSLVAYYSGLIFNTTELELFTENQTGYDR